MLNPNLCPILRSILVVAGLAPVAYPQSTALFADQASLSFDYVKGGRAPGPQAIGISSGEFQVFTVANIFQSPWLMATPSSGSSPATLQVAVDPNGLAPGIYDGQLQISTEQANSPPPVKVRLTVHDAPKLIVLPDSLSLRYQPDQSVPLQAALYVTSSGKSVQVSTSISGATWLEVRPTSAATPVNFGITVHPESLGPGAYHASVTISSPEAPSATVTIALTVTGPPPAFEDSGITNLASWLPGAVAPGEMLSIRGTDFGRPMDFIGQPDASHRLPSVLGDTQVFFDNTPAALLLAAPTTLTLFVPYEIAGRNTIQLTVVHQGAASKPLTLPVAVSSPGIFTQGPSGQGQAIALNQDLRLNTASNPAAPGSIIVFYMTGEGQTKPAGVDGLIAGSSLPTPLLPVSVLIDGKQAEVLFAGGVPTLAAGVIQVNAVIPAEATPGNPSIRVIVGPNTSREGVTIAVR